MHSFCPCALSFIFKPCPNTNPIKAGSIGVGCTIDKMVEVTIHSVGANHDSPLPHAIDFNGSPISFPTVDYVIRQLTDQPVTVKITSPLPLGYGFGISGASALATAYALHQFLNSTKPVETQNLASLHRIAHTAEIVHKTGLGTVATQITGGFLVKTAPGLPVQATRLPFAGQQLYVTIIDKMETPGILSDTSLLKQVNRAADQAMKKIKQSIADSSPLPKGRLGGVNSESKEPIPPSPLFGKEGEKISLGHLLDISYTFIQDSGLPVSAKTQAVIDEILHRGGSATMAILGQMVISTLPSADPRCLPVRITDQPIHWS